MKNFPTIHDFVGKKPFPSTAEYDKILTLFCIDVASGMFDTVCKLSILNNGTTIQDINDYVKFCSSLKTLPKTSNSPLSNLAKFWIYEKHPEYFI